MRENPWQSLSHQPIVGCGLTFLAPAECQVLALQYPRRPPSESTDSLYCIFKDWRAQPLVDRPDIGRGSLALSLFPQKDRDAIPWRTCCERAIRIACQCHKLCELIPYSLIAGVLTVES